jgi:hypothetical protein
VYPGAVHVVGINANNQREGEAKNPPAVPGGARATAIARDPVAEKLEHNQLKLRDPLETTGPFEDNSMASNGSDAPVYPGAMHVAGINTNNQREGEARIPPAVPGGARAAARGGDPFEGNGHDVAPMNSKAKGLKNSVEEEEEDQNYRASVLPIAAELAPDDDDVAKRVADRVQTELGKRLEREVAERMQIERDLQVVAEAVEVSNDNHKEHEDDDEICGVPSKCCYLILVIVFLVVAAGVAVGVFFATREGETPSPTMAPTDPPTVFPTDAPTNTPTRYTSERFKLLLDLIGPTVTSNIKLLQDPETLQYAALQWMADVDTWVVDINSLPLQLWVERYVLALFYLSTNGKSWREQYDFLQETSVCGWSDLELNEGVICDGLYVTELNFCT